MFYSYLLLALRHFVKRPLFSIVNVLSLSVGMAVALLILNYVVFEESYDNFNRDADRIYRVESQFYEGNTLTDDWGTSSYGYGTAMKRQISGIEQMVRADIGNPEQIVRYGDLKYRENTITAVDSTFFDLFSFTLRDGDPRTALNGPNKVVITPYAAEKYFKDENPLGKTLRFNSQQGEYFCEVTGVLEKLPRNSHLKFDFFMSWETLPRWYDNYWYRHEAYTYVRLAPGTDPRSVEKAFTVMSEDYKTEDALKNKTWKVVLNPLTDVHLTPWKQYEREAKGSRSALTVLTLVAFAILAIAWINYINLTTARSLERAREVGIRKVSGSTRRQLVGQFLLESTLMNLLALVIALFLVFLTTPLFNQLVGLEIGMVMLTQPLFWLVAFGTLAGGILLSGCYPAFIITNIDPLKVLKGKFIHSGRAGLVRKCLVVVQFVASLVLIAGTFAVDRQLAYMRSQPLGVSVTQRIAIKYPAATEELKTKMEAYKRELAKLPGVTGVTLSNSVPGMEVATFLSIHRTADAARQNRLYEMLMADYDYQSVYGLKVVAGRGFGEEFTGDEDRVVANRSATRALGFAEPAEALGQRLTIETRDDRPAEIIGVVEDYHQQGLNKLHTPILMMREDGVSWIAQKFISIACEPNKEAEVLAGAEKLWPRFFSESTFDSFFIDRFYDKQYEADRRFGDVFGLFSILALFIAIIGLWVLTLFSAYNRRKEMGVRKVFGATGADLFRSLSTEFFVLIGIAVLVGVPLAGWAMTGWLSGYPFRIGLTWWLYAVPVVVICAVTLLTIGGQVLATLHSNPIRSLKAE